MARWSTVIPTWTTGSGVADTTDFATGNHHSIQGGSSTQRGEMREIFLSGQAAASAPQYAVFGRNSQVATGSLTAPRLAAIDPATAALAAPPLPFTHSATNKSQRSATLGMLLALGFNAFGGIVRWVNGPDEIISYLGNTASFGELSLSFFTGNTSAAVQSGIVFETL